MHNSWHDWLKAFEKLKKDLANQGFEVVDIVEELGELTEYCKMRKIKNDRKACPDT
jgi:hypothetical protein